MISSLNDYILLPTWSTIIGSLQGNNKEVGVRGAQTNAHVVKIFRHILA